ncbi:unnamed protein product [Meloidogyne enterolobii]|uniref:Uncharacterized protein n=1 Tax=Meloidogyne enterolobii TaxID=390850 RepID=A0ACB0YGI7_MELEN
MTSRIHSKLCQLMKRRKIVEKEKEVNIAPIDQRKDEEEGLNVVELDVGCTQKGGLSLWYNSYRYIFTSKNCKSWRCSDRPCSAKVSVLSIEGDHARGIIMGEHDHVGDPVGLEVEKRRKVFNERIRANPTVKTRNLAEELRKGTSEDTELLVRFGTDNAVQQRAARLRKKAIGCVTKRPLKIGTATSLKEKNSECEKDDSSLFDFAQSLYKTWEEMGLVQLWNNGEIEGKSARECFRCLLALTLIPIQHVRRSFCLLMEESPLGLEDYFAYFCSAYIGMTEFENQLGSSAFRPGIEMERASHIGFARFGSFASTSLSTNFEPASGIFGQTEANSSGCKRRLSSIITPRWDLPIDYPAQFAVDFWNVHVQAMNDVFRTNNALDRLRHPGLPEYIFDFNETHTNSNRKPNSRNIINYANIRIILNGASYETDEEILDIVHLLGSQMEQLTRKLGHNKRNTDGEDDEYFEIALENENLSENSIVDLKPSI